MGKRAAIAAFERKEIQRLHGQQFGIRAIARKIGRAPSAVSRVIKRPNSKGAGRKKILDGPKQGRFLGALRRAVERAEAMYEVTLPLALGKWKGKSISLSTAKRILRQAGIKWKGLKERPVLTPAQMKKRFVFATENVGKRPAYWENVIFIDGKWYPLILRAEHRKWAAAQSVRGCYRKISDPPAPWNIKKRSKTKERVGGSMGVICAVVGPRQCVFVHEFHGKWCSQEAKIMYEKLDDFCWKMYPDRKGVWKIVEDGDPAGFRSALGRKTKESLGFSQIPLPPNSPDLQLLDYSVWSAANRVLRKQEREMKKGAIESKKSHKARIRKALVGLKKDFLKKSQRPMARRLKQCKKAKGGLFKE